MELADFREILVEIRILTVDLVELLGKFECTSGRVSSNEESEIPQIFRLRRYTPHPQGRRGHKSKISYVCTEKRKNFPPATFFADRPVTT